jgi:fructosamine-3-kinase
MNVDAAVMAALAAAGRCVEVASQADLSGGCIHRVVRLTLADATEVVAKINRAGTLNAFEEEAKNLNALAETKSVVVPKPLSVISDSGAAVLLMTAIRQSQASGAGWQQFGRDLATLHSAAAGNRYGWATDNHLGSLPQLNAWHDDWVTFNAVNRLGFQHATARDNGLLTKTESRAIDRAISGLDRLIPRKPRPSLLHGDLWSGNVLATTIVQDGTKKETCAVIDPACSVGDALADIAMMQLFGGFWSECFNAYEEASGRRLGDDAAKAAIRVYQLYHVLNHVNLFGRGYVDHAMTLARRLGGDQDAGMGKK